MLCSKAKANRSRYRYGSRVDSFSTQLLGPLGGLKKPKIEEEKATLRYEVP